MTKRIDDADLPDMEEGMTTAERRRRRRRGAGLRVPSDNVPRRSQQQPVVAPVPEDPNLAVSIAYSFGSDASQPVQRPASDGSFLDAEEEEEAAEMRGVARLPGDGSPAGGVASTSGVPRTSAALAAAAAAPEQLEAAAGDIVADGRTREMPAIQLEELGLEVPEFLQDDDGERGDTVIVPPEEAPAPERITGRAGTVALSDDDLEELAPPSAKHARANVGPSALAAFDDHSGTNLPTVRFRPDSEITGESVDIDIDAGSPMTTGTAEDRATTDPMQGRERDRDRGTPPEGEEVALDDGDLQDEVVQPADPSDSGEILSDELIEEVEAQSAAAVKLRTEPEPVASITGAQAPEPVAAPRADTAPLPVAAKEPASAPPSATAKPPPAPTAKPPPAPPAPPRKPSAARVAAVAAAVNEKQDAKEERRRRAKPWFEEIFDEDYLRTLPFLTPQATQSEAQFVAEALGVQAGGQVLDLGCGYGRHAMELAARGFHVVGLDLSLPLLLRGADEAQRRGLTINFVHGDMRELDFDSQFDGAYCVFSTFGFFDDETNKKTLSNLSRALKPGARIVLDILNRDYLIADLPTRVWWEGDGCVVLEEVEFNYFSSRIQCNRSVVFDDGRQVEQEISMRAYSLHEIGKLLHGAGFRVLEISGSMVTRGRFFGGSSRQIIVIAERRPKDPNGKADKEEVTRA